MLLEFQDLGDRRPIWVNPEHIVAVENWTTADSPGGASTVMITVGGAAVRVVGEPRDVARRINDACRDNRLLPPVQTRQESHRVEYNVYRHCKCIHCGHSYGESPYVHYVCGAMPRCPICNRYQSPWEYLPDDQRVGLAPPMSP